MKGLIIKDLINIKKEFKTLLIALLLFVYMSYQTRNPIQITSMAVILFGILILTTIGYDEMSKWDIYALTMPLKRSEIVISKYVLLLLLTIIPLIISSIFSYLVILPISDMSRGEFLVADMASFSLILIMLSISLPFVYKYGVSRSRLIMFIVMGIPSIVFVLIGKYVSIDQAMVEKLLLVTPILAIAIFSISLQTSIKIYKTKEF